MTADTTQTFDSAAGDFRAEARHLAASMPFPAKALTVAAGFVVFPPLGVATLAYFVYQSRRAWRDGVSGAAGYDRSPMGRCGHHGRRGFRQRGMTGNSALDEKRSATLRALDEEAEAFHDFRRNERETRDREAFERFMTARNATAGETTKA